MNHAEHLGTPVFSFVLRNIPTYVFKDFFQPLACFFGVGIVCFLKSEIGYWPSRLLAGCILGIAITLAFYFHELAHAAVFKWGGINITGIFLSSKYIGIGCHLDENSAFSNKFVAGVVAGPLTNLFIATGCFYFKNYLPKPFWFEIVHAFMIFNIIAGLASFIPIRGQDGSKILNSLMKNPLTTW